MTRIPNANAVKSLMYVMMFMCPNIYLAFGFVSYFQSNPEYDHSKAIKGILHYLRDTTYYMF